MSPLELHSGHLPTPEGEENHRGSLDARARLRHFRFGAWPSEPLNTQAGPSLPAAQARLETRRGDVALGFLGSRVADLARRLVGVARLRVVPACAWGCGRRKEGWEKQGRRGVPVTRPGGEGPPRAGSWPGSFRRKDRKADAAPSADPVCIRPEAPRFSAC